MDPDSYLRSRYSRASIPPPPQAQEARTVPPLRLRSSRVEGSVSGVWGRVWFADLRNNCWADRPAFPDHGFLAPLHTTPCVFIPLPNDPAERAAVVAGDGMASARFALKKGCAFRTAFLIYIFDRRRRLSSTNFDRRNRRRRGRRDGQDGTNKYRYEHKKGRHG